MISMFVSMTIVKMLRLVKITSFKCKRNFVETKFDDSEMRNRLKNVH